MGDDILFYLRNDPYGWLSNFWRAPQIVDGIIYPTNEHYYQAMKARDPVTRQWITQAPRAFYAMEAGRALRDKDKLENWEAIKIKVMLNGLRAKFRGNLDIQRLLVETYPAKLHEDSSTDMFWGIKGRDMLGVLLMSVRNEFIHFNNMVVITDGKKWEEESEETTTAAEQAGQEEK